MSITPNEILEKEFEARFRGYDKDEVRAFLEEVANYLASVIKERNELKDRVLSYKKQIAHLKQQEAEFRRALTAAHEAAEEMKTGAKKEAELIVERAKLDADRIVQDAHQEAVELEDRIRRLRMKQRETVFKIRSSFEGFMRLLDEEMALPPEEMDETLKIAAQEVMAIQGEGPEGSRNGAAAHESQKGGSNLNGAGTQDKDEIKDIEMELSELENKDKLNESFGFEPSKLWPED